MMRSASSCCLIACKRYKSSILNESRVKQNFAHLKDFFNLLILLRCDVHEQERGKRNIILMRARATRDKNRQVMCSS